MEFSHLPPTAELQGQKRLNLSGGLTEFPLELLDLADSLEILDLSDNQLTALPEEVAQLHNLKVIFLNNNAFEEFPKMLKACPKLSMVSFKGNQLRTIQSNSFPPSLRWLILTDNQIESLPADIGLCTRLQKLMLAGNQLQSLPDELANCQNLELIRLAANRLHSLPDWLFTLPRLSWLAFAGNPFCNGAASLAESEAGRSLPPIHWENLQVGEVLGQGASGIIYKGMWSTSPSSSSPRASQNPTQEVAIKLFKGTMTSDGNPLDEMRAYIAAGSHPNLVNVLGTVHNNPDGKAGLVFSLIPSDYSNLGNPPDLDTCTRDTFEADVSFTLPAVRHILQSIASVAVHLHERGIMHGDLYAHNILVNQAGMSILGDFGAASFYPSASGSRQYPHGYPLESLEVRAFGCLLDDLLNRCYVSQANVNQHDTDPGDAAIFNRLRQLQQDCLHLIPANRPSFDAICQTLLDG